MRLVQRCWFTRHSLIRGTQAPDEIWASARRAHPDCGHHWRVGEHSEHSPRLHSSVKLRRSLRATVNVNLCCKQAPGPGGGAHSLAGSLNGPNHCPDRNLLAAVSTVALRFYGAVRIRLFV